MNWDEDDIRRLRSLMAHHDVIVGIPKLDTRIEGVEKSVSAITRRVDSLSMTEGHAKEMEVLRKTHMDEKFSSLKRDICSIKEQIQNATRWFIFTVGGAVIVAVVGFAMNGGFKIP
ncbi:MULTISPECIES: hypothetical protein [unclassified Aurantimonas]|uniref:hypothetical protein n=1 Tax=unclassified Aurantimonas TaxID=2638230 RepID=UPI002E16C4A9|nr:MULTISPECIES: hypothetical protein [unclassified Aurantimonas]MEC5291581.1 hypothetical protein [Aurantimonas sp. C2-3-R2]MEC5412665.1 hypothetical protein [Aurantimonas sp. C2-4-R8]